MTNGNVLKRNATQSNNQAGQPDQAAQASQSKQTNQTNQAQAATTGATIAKLAMVITTYKRQNLLATLFDSILALEQAPWRIVVVDNEHSDETRGMVEEFEAKVTDRWGKTVVDGGGNKSRVVYAP